MNISAIIITRNEEINISKCIESVKWADEIIVVDNNSMDQTRTIAKSAGAKVYDAAGLDFSYIRNIGKEKASGKWLLYIDADERVTPELAKEIKEKIKSEDNFSSYAVTRKNYFFGNPWPKQEQIIRLLKKDALIGWQGSLHESPQVIGVSGKLNFPLLHYTHSDISSMMKKTDEWSEVEANLRYQNNHPSMNWWRFFRVIITSFWRSFIQDQGWKAGTTGLIESIYQSFSMFITYAKLWELQNKSSIEKNPEAQK